MQVPITIPMSASWSIGTSLLPNYEECDLKVWKEGMGPQGTRGQMTVKRVVSSANIYTSKEVHDWVKMLLTQVKAVRVLRHGMQHQSDLCILKIWTWSCRFQWLITSASPLNLEDLILPGL